jgi:type IV secretion system protein VirD4
MSNLLGSAAWSADTGHWRYHALGADGMPEEGRYLLLGECPNRRGFLHVRAPLQHMLSIAPTRSGKGVSLIIPNLLTYVGSALVVDPKGENAWVTADRRRQGHKTVIVDPWGEVNRRYGAMAGVTEPIARFNPLAGLDPGSDEYVDDVAALADAIIISEGTREPHWDNSARELVAGLIAFVVESPAYHAEASLGLVRALLSLPGPELRVAVKDARNLGAGSLAKAKLARFEGETNEIDGVISTARTQTAFLDSPTLKRNLEVSDFSFEELCSGKTSIYLVLPPDKLETYGRWLRLMVTAGIRAVARRGSQSPSGLPVLFMLDEFGTIGKLSAVAQAFGLMAGLGMILWVFAQDLNQLKRDYPEHWETFIGNSQAVTCFGVMDNFTADYISKMLGTTTVQQTNIATSYGTSVAPIAPGSSMWAANRTSYSSSTNTSTATMSRPLLHPDEVRGLNGELCIIMGRFPPIIARRIVYHADWRFLHWARPDPHFPRTEQVRWGALQNRLYEFGSVAGLLGLKGYTVKRRWRGRWEVRHADGSGAQIFANDNDLWRWTYMLVMDDMEKL